MIAPNPYASPPEQAYEHAAEPLRPFPWLAVAVIASCCLFGVSMVWLSFLMRSPTAAMLNGVCLGWNLRTLAFVCRRVAA